jgi:hypothetical protein
MRSIPEVGAHLWWAPDGLNRDPQMVEFVGVGTAYTYEDVGYTEVNSIEGHVNAHGDKAISILEVGPKEDGILYNEGFGILVIGAKLTDNAIINVQIQLLGFGGKKVRTFLANLYESFEEAEKSKRKCLPCSIQRKKGQ